MYVDRRSAFSITPSKPLNSSRCVSSLVTTPERAPWNPALLLLSSPICFGSGREYGAPAHVVDLDLRHGQSAQQRRQRLGEHFALGVLLQPLVRQRVRGLEERHELRPDRVGEHPRHRAVVGLAHRDERVDGKLTIKHAEDRGDDHHRNEARERKIAKKFEHEENAYAARCPGVRPMAGKMALGERSARIEQGPCHDQSVAGTREDVPLKGRWSRTSAAGRRQ
jgi:hypothetical protein